MNEKDTMTTAEPLERWRTVSGFSSESERMEQAEELVNEGKIPEAYSLLKEIIKDDSESDDVRYDAMRFLASMYSYPNIDKESIVQVFKDVVESTLEDDWSDPRRDALIALAHLHNNAWKGAPSALDVLLQLATDVSLSKQVQADALLALAETRSQKAIEPLARGIIEGNGMLVQGMKEIHSKLWTDKVVAFLDYIENHPITRADVNAKDIVRALSPTWGEDIVRRSTEIGNFIIEKSRDCNDERMAGIFAELLIETEGGDQIQAGYRINEYQKDHQISAGELEGLRVAVGGAPALSGVMGVLQRDLQNYFQQPINELNKSTMKAWEKTIESARNGLILRLWMSGTVFVIGLALLLVSSGRILLVSIDWSAGILFLAGLGTMILIIYTGPMKEIRQAVTDLATNSAAFIAYVHQVLETSHTFSFYYLHEKISFEHMKQSSSIIKEAMMNTIDALNREARDSSEQTINEALERLKTVLPGNYEVESGGDGKDLPK